MPNWRKLVKERLATRGLAPSVEEEVVAELAAHLEESYTEACARGLGYEQAIAVSMREVEDWKVLRENICRAKSGGDSMNHRTKTLWLPGLATLWAVGVLLVLLDRAAFLQRLIWIGCMAMLLCTAASEANRLNQRTKSFWLPGFVSLTGAMLFLLAADLMHSPSILLTEIGLQPRDLVQFNSGPAHSVYFPWLVAQVAFGALGASLSRRAGGNRAERIAAAGLPVIVIVGMFAVVLPISFLIERGVTPAPHPAYVAVNLLVWVLAPAIALLLGAAPFLKEPKLQQDGAAS